MPISTTYVALLHSSRTHAIARKLKRYRNYPEIPLSLVLDKCGLSDAIEVCNLIPEHHNTFTSLAALCLQPFEIGLAGFGKRRPAELLRAVLEYMQLRETPTGASLDTRMAVMTAQCDKMEWAFRKMLTNGAKNTGNS